MSEKLAPWRTYLQKALHKNRANIFSRYFALATVTKDGFPSNRIVVFRGFLEDTNNLEIITDIRSQKYQHLIDNPWGEICWYFAKTREQFRIHGQIKLITEIESETKLLEERIKVWQKLSTAGKEQFYWDNPGELFTSNNNNYSLKIDDNNPNNNFCLLLFIPQKVDHLELKGNPQNRFIYELKEDNYWSVKQVNP